MSEEEEIIQEIRDNITDNEGKYMLCDALEDIIKNNNKKYDIQIIVSGLLDLYKQEKQKNKALKEGLKYRINYCKLLEKELYANGVNYEFEKTEIEKQFLEE